MTKAILGAIGAVLVGATATAGVLYSGALSFAADEPHAGVVTTLIQWSRERSIARSAAGITVPKDLNDPERIRRGAGNYAAMCAGCHLSPGAGTSEIAAGLYPAPPNLAKRAGTSEAETADARDFQVIKHGIKGSGMPAWSKGGMEDGAIWDMVAFLKVMPDMTPDAYKAQVAASDGHSHAGADGHHETPATPTKAPEKRDSHKHDTSDAGHSHKH